MAQSSEIKLLKRFDQDVEITGTLTVGGNSVLTSVPSEYLTQTEGDARYLQSFDITTQTDSKYLRSDANDTTSGTLTVDGGHVKINGDAGNIAKLSLNESTVEEHVILEYDGTGSGATNYFHIYSGLTGWAAKGTSFNIQPSTGDVNIGATNFGYKFRVEGTTYITSDTTIGGLLTINGSDGVSRLHINGETPTINLDDSNGDSFYIHVNSNNFYILADRDGAGDYNTWEAPHPLKLEADTNTGYVFDNAIIHSGNIGSQSVGYAAVAGNSGLLDGLDSTDFVKQLSNTSSPDYQTPSSRRVDPNASNPTNEHYAVTTFGNGGNVTGQLATHFVSGLPYTRGYNSGWSAWRKIWTDANDGSGSGLDADLLDGLHSSNFFRNGDTNLQMANNDGFVYDDTNNIMYVRTDGSDYKIWHSGNDGPGSGLNADLLNSQNGNYYDQRQYTRTDNYLGGFYVSGGTEKPNSPVFGAGKFKVAMLRGGSNNLGFGGTWNDVMWLSTYNGTDVKRSLALVSSKYDNTSVWIAKQNFDATDWGTGYLIWNSGNDGSGSGLDADLLDGQHGSFYTTANNITSGTLPADRLPWNSNDDFTGTYPLVWKAGTTPYTASWLKVDGSTDTFHTRNIDFTGYRLLRSSNSSSDIVNIRGDSSGQYFRMMSGQSGFGVADSEWTHTLHVTNLGPSNGNRAEIYHNSTKDIYIGNTTYPSPIKMHNSLSLGIPGYGSNAYGRFISLEGNTDGSGEGSGRIFFAEHNSSTAAMDAYGMSIGYRGGATTITGASGNSWTGLSQISNGSWGMWGHNGDATGRLVMYGDRAATYISLNDNELINVRQITLNNGFRFKEGASNYASINSWVYLEGVHGIYTGTNGAHFYPNDGGDYGSWRINGARNGWNGLSLNGQFVFMSNNSNRVGLYNDINNEWMFQAWTNGDSVMYHNGNVRITANSAGASITGSLTASGDVIAYSDERVKENIKTISNALDKVTKLRGVEYNKIGEDKQSIGVIAQEIEKILPQVVSEDSEGMKGVAYGNIVGVLIEAIKEQQKQIDELKAMIK